MIKLTILAIALVLFSNYSMANVSRSTISVSVRVIDPTKPLGSPENPYPKKNLEIDSSKPFNPDIELLPPKDSSNNEKKSND